MSEITRWLNASSASPDDELFAGLYAELQKIARGRIAGERAGQTLDADGLVHEAWLRLQKSAPEQWRDRKQFYAAAAEAMRRILVEAARRRLAAKRGGGQAALPLDENDVPAPIADERLLGVHNILNQLTKKNKIKTHIIKLHFFNDLKHNKITSLLKINKTTVHQH